MTKAKDECSQNAYIYALGDPRTGEIYYIGSTVNPQQRWAAHRSTNVTVAREAKKRLEELRRLGLHPVFVRLHITDRQKQFIKEFETIREFKARGFPLLNRNKSYEERKWTSAKHENR